MDLHVRYTFKYTSLPRSANQQREMTSVKAFGRTGAHDRNFFFLFLDLSDVPTNLVPGSSAKLDKLKELK